MKPRIKTQILQKSDEILRSIWDQHLKKGIFGGMEWNKNLLHELRPVWALLKVMSVC